MVGDDNEVAAGEEFTEHVAESLHVGLVERRIHFVQDAERARLALEDAHQQSNGGHGLLSAGELTDDARLLAWWLGANLHARLQDVHLAGDFVRNQEQVSTSAAKQTSEHAAVTRKVLSNRVEHLLKANARNRVKLHDEFAKQGGRGIDVAHLANQFLVALLQLPLFLDGVEVDVAKLADFVLESSQFLLSRTAIGLCPLGQRPCGNMFGVAGSKVQFQVAERRLFQRLALNFHFTTPKFHAVPVALQDVRLVAGDAQRGGCLFGTSLRGGNSHCGTFEALCEPDKFYSGGLGGHTCFCNGGLVTIDLLLAPVSLFSGVHALPLLLIPGEFGGPALAAQDIQR